MNTFRTLLASLVIMAFATTACQKEVSNSDDNSNDNGNANGTHLVRIRQGVGNSEWGDSTTCISYDGDKIVSVYDSLTEPDPYGDTLSVKYDEKGRISSVKSNHGDYGYYTYDSSGLLTHATVKYGYIDDYNYVYTNGVLTKKEWLTGDEIGSSNTKLYRYYTFTVTNGNITGKKEYSPGGELLSEQTYTYSTEKNIFKNISLINISNIFGFSPFADYYSNNFDTYFNTNLMSTYSIKGKTIGTFTHTFNNQHQLTKLLYTTTGDVPDQTDIFTYQFFYQ